MASDAFGFDLASASWFGSIDDFEHWTYSCCLHAYMEEQSY